MPLKPLGRPFYLLPDEVQQDDVLEIMDKPYIVPAEMTKWNKERAKVQVKIIRTELIRTWNMNNTTFDKLLDAFGEDPGLWLGKKVQVKKETRNINGVDKVVLFGKPYVQPQQQLSSEQTAPAPANVDEALMQQIKQLAPEEKQRLLQSLEHP